jgi:hypothetical protein
VPELEKPPSLPAEPSTPDDFPTGWKLEKDSWHFHRRFYVIFRREAFLSKAVKAWD